MKVWLKKLIDSYYKKGTVCSNPKCRKKSHCMYIDKETLELICDECYDKRYRQGENVND